MNILKTTPKQDGYWMPAEFEKHDGCLMIWPERTDSWPYGAKKAREAFVKVASAIAKSEKVTMCASYKQYPIARAMLPSHIRVIEMSNNDAWARDVGPTIVKNKEGNIRGIDWYFNAWGGLEDGLYFPWDKDNQMAMKVCDLLDIDVYDAKDFVLEGGAIHVDGEGTAMVTEACLLSNGRNPDMSKEEITQKLKDYLNVEKVIWLKNGIYQDETNEHIDNICAFVKPGEVVLGWTDDQNDPQYAYSKSCLDILEKERDAKGRKIIVHKLPMPNPIYVTKEDCDGLDPDGFEPTHVPGDRLAASYVNFYIANGAIIMPKFNDPHDEAAINILQSLFKDKEIIAIEARDILIGGGNIHCITQQIPKEGK